MKQKVERTEGIIIYRPTATLPSSRRLGNPARAPTGASRRDNSTRAEGRTNERDMPYLPPHLRGGSGDPGSGSDSDGGRGGGRGGSWDSRDRDGGGSYGRDDRRDGGGSRYDDRRGGDRYGDDRRGGGDRYDDRRSDSRRGSEVDLSAAASRGRYPPAIFPKWKPSERVQALTVNQIEEIRRRMDVTVECKEGDEAAPPVESFEDMMLVRRAKRRRVARDDDDDDLADLARGALFFLRLVASRASSFSAGSRPDRPLLSSSLFLLPRRARRRTRRSSSTSASTSTTSRRRSKRRRSRSSSAAATSSAAPRRARARPPRLASR